MARAAFEERGGGRGLVVAWNVSAARMFGYSSGEALGAHISLIVPEDRRTDAEATMRRRVGPTLRARLTPRARAVGNR